MESRFSRRTFLGELGGAAACCWQAAISGGPSFQAESCQAPTPTPKPSKKPTCDSIQRKVKQIVVEQLGVDEKEVRRNASFTEDLGADSLDMVELIMALEESFEIEIPDEDAEKMKTVGQAMDYMCSHLGASPKAAPGVKKGTKDGHAAQ